MNLFRSNSAPFLLALIVSALGWYVGEINSDIRNTKVAIYRLDADANAPQATVVIENASRTQSLQNIVLALDCQGNVDDSKTPRNSGTVIHFPPIATISEAMDPRRPGHVGVTASLAPGGALGLQARLADCDSPLEFSYQPRVDSGFLLLNARSLRGWMAKNYIDALPVVFLALAALFIGWLLVSLFFWWRRRNESPVVDNVYNVRLLSGESAELGTARTRGKRKNPGQSVGAGQPAETGE